MSLLGLALIGAAPVDDGQPLTIEVQGLRSAKGNILICLTQSPKHFPDCSGDSASRHMVVPATRPQVALGPLPPGGYAIAIIHDENGNGRIDTMAGVPREGVGFSNNPRLWFGPPRFASARFTVADAPVRQQVKLKYFL